MNRIKRKINNQKGSYAIISVILIFIILTAITAYTDIIKKRWTINEVQSVMDASGTNALKKTVDLQALYKEKVGKGGYYTQDNVDKSKIIGAVDNKYKDNIKKAYLEELNNQVRFNDVVQSMEVDRVEVSFDYTNFGLGAHKGKEIQEEHPQFMIDSIVRMKVKTSRLFDVGNSVTSAVYSSKNGKDFQVTYRDATEDGYTELIIRSFTRLVYR